MRRDRQNRGAVVHEIRSVATGNAHGKLWNGSKKKNPRRGCIYPLHVTGLGMSQVRQRDSRSTDRLEFGLEFGGGEALNRGRQCCYTR